MLRANQLDADRAFVLVVDVQEKLLPAINGHEKVVASTCKLLEGVRIFELPVLATEQYPRGIGSTVAPVREALAACHAPVLEKMAFSTCGESTIRDAINAIDRPQCLIAGIEAHVCVQQTALDLVVMGLDVYVCADAVGSRGRADYECALHRMRQEGVWVTSVESALFELCNRCDTPRFKSMIEIIKAHPPFSE